MGKKELVALLNLSFWCLVMVERLFLAVPRGCLRFVLVVFPDHIHYFFSKSLLLSYSFSNTYLLVSYHCCFRELVKKQSLDLICNSYKQMYDVISDPVNEYREPQTIVPRTPDQVLKLLS